MFFSLFTKKKKNTDYNEMDNFVEKEYCDDVISTAVVAEEEEEEQKQENKDDVIKKARDLLKDAIKIFT
jgi:hypothetical protein